MPLLLEKKEHALFPPRGAVIIIRDLSVLIFQLSSQGPGVMVLLLMSAQRSIEVLGQSSDINEWAGPQHLQSPHRAQTFVKGQRRKVFACRHEAEQGLQPGWDSW